MILRRLSQSLKEQNWTAITIEFVLLVVGVFLGIQVSNWNAERENRQKGAVFTARLREDLRQEAWRYRFLLDDGRTQDVIADRDDSDLRDAVLTRTKASKIVGVAQLDC